MTKQSVSNFPLIGYPGINNFSFAFSGLIVYTGYYQGREVTKNDESRCERSTSTLYRIYIKG